MEEYENDEMIMVEADFEIIRKLTNKIDLLDKNLDNLINNNNRFIENMLTMDTSKDSSIGDNNNDDKNEIENNLEFVKNKLHNMKLEELKNICKKNGIKKYSIYNKNNLIDYIINYKDINKIIF
jgi:hypothetical protein